MNSEERIKEMNKEFKEIVYDYNQMYKIIILLQHDVMEKLNYINSFKAKLETIMGIEPKGNKK